MYERGSTKALSASGDKAGSSSPLWQVVLTLILQRIRTGKYPVGHTLPREVDLADEFQVSRNTIRTAVKALADDGLVVQRKRAGTLIVSTGQNAPFRITADPLGSLKHLMESSRFRIQDRLNTSLPASVLSSYPDADPGEWRRVAVVRQMIADGRALFFSRVYLHPRLVALEPLIEYAKGPVFDLIEKHTGESIQRIDSVIKPYLIDKETANTLGVAENSLGMYVSRRMLTKKGELVEVSDTIFPESLCELEISFAPGQRVR